MTHPARLATAGLMFAITFAGGCKSGGGHEEQGGIPPDAKIDEIKAEAPGADVHVAAGDLAVGQGKPAEAIRQYEKAIALDPNNKLALYKMAALYTYTQQFDLAISTWQRYVDATNQSANGYVNLGRANELAGKWKPAEVAYLRAINREPLNKPAHVNYGIFLAKRNRMDEAQAQLAKVLSPAEVEYNLGSVFELRKDFATAKTHYNKSIELDPTFAAPHQRLAMMKEVAKAE